MIRTTLFTLLIFLAAGLPASRSTAGDAELDGAFTQGGMVTGRIDGPGKVRLNGEPVKVSEDGHFVIGFGRDAALEHELSVTDASGLVSSQRIILEAREYNIERIDGLPERTVTIPEAERARRHRERSMVAAARDRVSNRLDWTGRFIWPASGRVSGVYGSQRILNGKPRWPHYGLDVAAPIGTPVRAPLGGVITLAEPNFLLEGGIIIIDHGFGVTSTLFHLNSVEVGVGQQVDQGQRIGTVGATGRASGAHVDWRVNWNSVRLDPQLLVGPMPDE